MINFYNVQVELYKKASKNGESKKIEEFVSTDETKIKWDQGLMDDASKFKPIIFDKKSVRTGLFRPFTKQALYFDKSLNWSRYQLPSLFPKPNSEKYFNMRFWSWNK